jgi:hypothetical protein
MARKGNKPDKMDTEKETESKRRYQSPQTPPQAPRSSAGTHQGRGREARPQDEQDADTEEFDTESFGEGRAAGRGTSQEYGQDQQQGRGLTRDDEQGGAGRQQEWQSDMDESESGRAAGRGSDFDLQKASRDELNAIARELEIEDYETMNREELVMEIRERS